ncbi:MAG: putative bicarbonate transporter, IctB family, partial [Acidobacteria bacterium]|nr:putative bicarbonate transporter, IctB family [Acidobacteriota bacterium]
MTTTSLAATWYEGERLEAAATVSLLVFVTSLQFSIAAANILLVAVLLLWAALVVTRREQVRVPRMFWPLAAYGAWTLISAAASPDPAASFIDSRQLVLLLVVPAVYRLARGDGAERVATLIITMGAVSALFGVIQYGILHYDNLGRRPQGTLTHYMTYSGEIMLVVGAAVARLLFRREDRLWTALVMPVLLVALALTFTRSAWVGACGAIGVLLVLKDRRLLAALPVLVAVFIMLAPQPIVDRAYSMFDLNDPTNRDRVAMAKAGLGMIRDHPVVGVGPNMVKEQYAAYRDPGAVEARPVHLHNVPIQIAAERGLPA